MALAYPEGEVFFLRSSLHFNDTNKWNASNAENFYSHVLIEYAWNECVEIPARTQYSHARANYIRGWVGVYGYYDKLPISIGPHDNIKRRYDMQLSSSADDFIERGKGGPQKVFSDPEHNRYQY
jgi:hypothetical protein